MSYAGGFLNALPANVEHHAGGSPDQFPALTGLRGLAAVTVVLFHQCDHDNRTNVLFPDVPKKMLAVGYPTALFSFFCWLSS